MDPATIYAITVTLVGVGLPPKVSVEPLPPQWAMADCIKDHEEKLAGLPNTMARCVSRDRPFEPQMPRNTIWTVGISRGWGGTVHNQLKTSTSLSPFTLKQCERKRARENGKWGSYVFCVRSHIKPQTLCRPEHGLCIIKPS